MVRGEVLKKGTVVVKEGLITYVGENCEAPSFEAEREIDAEGKIVMPGLINCHTHAAMSLFRGFAEDLKIDKWLKEKIWPLEAKLKPADVYYGTLLSCLEMIKSGTTCFSDMYFYEEMVAKAVQEAGLRAVIAPGIIEAGDAERGRKMLEDAVKIVKKYHGAANGRITVRLGPHAVYTCSLMFLKEIRRASSSLNVGIHIHLAESEANSDSIRRLYGKREIKLLEDIGFLDSDMLAAHCVHLSREEITSLATHDVKVAYNPIANMKLASGVPRVKDLMNAGVTVGLGSDGPASNNSLDMFETMKFAVLLQRVFYKDPTVLSARRVLEMATIEGAKALRLDNITGSLEVGKRADLILIDAEKPHLTPMHDPYANIVYSARGSDVDTVMVDGKIIMENREVKTLNEEEAIRKAEETALDLLNR